jgi:hypothetical protein
MGGRMYEQQNKRWITRVMETLAQRSRDDRTVAADPSGGSRQID